ncbi:MAG: metallophosphoesterase [archaeon]|nr:metallophosphoesterase [archaeon]
MYKIQIENPDKLFFTSDTHFGHFNIIKYCKRPFTSTNEMNEVLIKNWNEVVPEDGIVIHCGDFILPHQFGISEYKKYLQKLNGTIFLCRGNHDRICLGNYDTDYVFSSLTEYSVFDSLPTVKLLKLTIVDNLTICVDGLQIFAQHYPALAYNGNCQVFGHIHTLKDGTYCGINSNDKNIIGKHQYDVGVDQNDYKPISYWELCDKIFIQGI